MYTATHYHIISKLRYHNIMRRIYVRLEMSAVEGAGQGRIRVYRERCYCYCYWWDSNGESLTGNAMDWRSRRREEAQRHFCLPSRNERIKLFYLISANIRVADRYHNRFFCLPVYYCSKRKRLYFCSN